MTAESKQPKRHWWRFSLRTFLIAHLRFRPGVTLNHTEPPVWLGFEATLPNDNPATMTFTLEAQTDTVGIDQTIDAYNFSAGQYELINTRSASFNQDSVVVVDLSNNIVDYVQSGTGIVKTRLGWKANGFVLLFPWTVSINQLVWTVT